MPGRFLTTCMLLLSFALCAASSALASDAGQTGGATTDNGSSTTTKGSGASTKGSGASRDTTGGAAYGAPTTLPPPQITVPGLAAQIVDGYAAAPQLAPPAVQQAIWKANEIVGKPYRYGGGHARSFQDSAYDCSGTVSYALSGAALVRRPLDSSSFMHWGEAGKGAWITVFTNPGHAFAVIAGLRLDTSAAGDPSGAKGAHWRPVLRSTRGFRARHPLGL